LCEEIFKKPVVLTDYPKEIKAFYMKLNEDGKTVAAADILVPKIGELVGGSQREHRHDVLVQRCEESGVEPASLWWYVGERAKRASCSNTRRGNHTAFLNTP